MKDFLKLEWRVSNRNMLLFETLIMLAAFSYGYLTRSQGELVWLLGMLCLLHLLLFMIPFSWNTGLNNVLHDEEPNSPWVIYHFVAMGAATFLGALFDSMMADFLLSL